MKKAHEKSDKQAAELFQKGLDIVYRHPIFNKIAKEARICREERRAYAKDCLCVAVSGGYIYCNPHSKAAPDKWARAIAHALLHLGLAHFKEKARQQDWNAVCDCVVEHFLSDLKFGKPFDVFRTVPPVKNEDDLYERLEFMPSDEKQEYKRFGTAGSEPDMIFSSKQEVRWHHKKTDWPALLAEGLQEAVWNAVSAVSDEARPRRLHSKYGRAVEWFINSYPLLGAIAAQFRVIDDPQICIREQISIAAVAPDLLEVYMNPAAGLDAEEIKFVMAHEFLHAALRHGGRCAWRDPYLWNVACDFVVNRWLTEMGVGERPERSLYDEQFNGLNAEAIYDIIVTDLRIYRKLATLRGIGLGDILGAPNEQKVDTDLDEFYRRSLSQGLYYHREQERGYLPSGLVEEIRALSVPPIPWDVELARWFENYFAPLEKQRTYARISRRQSATPNIPRPNRRIKEGALDGRTFGVLLDTSGSMERRLLAAALGAIASYAASRDVPAARVVFCDAAAYDMGYMRPEDIAGTVKVRGRGGTVLQPGINLLDESNDFPQEAPLLIITDGQCDKIALHGREHAYLIPLGANLPFAPKGKVFRLK